MSENIREITVLALMETLEKDAYSHIVLKNVLDKYAYLDTRDRHFISRLFKGTIEQLIGIDFILDSVSKTKVKKMKPFVRTLLRMSTYQIIYMDSIPDSAAVNEAVKLMKRHGFAPLGGFANGVLRAVSKGKPFDLSEKPFAKYSIPQWILDMWQRDFKDLDIDEVGNAIANERPLCIRLNNKFLKEEIMETLKKEKVSITETSLCENALFISDYDRIDTLESFRKGMFYIQDLTSQLVVESAGIKPGDMCIDVCAAPGGKTVAAAMLAGSTGRVDSRDLTDMKTGLIRENVKRMGLDNVDIKVWDATAFDESIQQKADVLICDLPCSGLGIISKKPDIKYRIKPEDIDALAELQKKILDTVFDYVKPGGRLVFSTCTISKKENQGQAKEFLEEHQDFRKISETQYFPTSEHDGFYVCVMERK